MSPCLHGSWHGARYLRIARFVSGVRHDVLCILLAISAYPLVSMARAFYLWCIPCMADLLLVCLLVVLGGMGWVLREVPKYVCIGLRRILTSVVENLGHLSCLSPPPSFRDRAEYTKARLMVRRAARRHAPCVSSDRSHGKRVVVRPSCVGRFKRLKRQQRRARKRNAMQEQVVDELHDCDLRCEMRMHELSIVRRILRSIRKRHRREANRVDGDSSQEHLHDNDTCEAHGVNHHGHDERDVVACSWRNQRCSMYYHHHASRMKVTLLNLLKKLLLFFLLLLIVSPLPVLTLPTSVPGVRHVMTSVGEVAFMSAEHVAQAKQDLDKLKAMPHDGPRLTAQFTHGINSYLPDGVSSSIDPSRYEKDPECELVMDRVPGVSDHEFECMREMLREMAPEVVAYSMEQITGYNGVEPPMRIDLTTTAPIFCPPRRNWSPTELQIIDEKCSELLKSGIVSPITTSSYACNPVLAMKRAPDGTWSDKRFCVNFIPINKHTELDRYGSHRADDLFQRVVKAKYLTALDLRSGFHQIPMHPDSINKTAFWYVSGKNKPPQLLAYSRMPFGLKNASAKFQRVMDAELARSGCSEFAFAYIDDLLIASDTYEEHVEHVRRVLLMLKECNLKIHPDKSVFGTNIIEYLGHNVIGQTGVTMNEAKVEAIKALPHPTNIGELRSILGFLTYYRHFIPGFLSIAAPLNELLKKDVKWEWGPNQKAPYATLRQCMTKPGLALRPVDPN